MHTLSVIIISKNEADRIVPCLESVKDLADEIILFDSGSTDRTVEIARRYTDKVWVTEDWPGYGFQKQRALDQATCDWVLSIDADEFLDKKMQQTIKSLLEQDRIAVAAYKLPWGNIILGRQLRHGRSSRAPLRLFKREGASFTPVAVHERVIVNGKVMTLKEGGYLVHNSLRGFAHWLEKNRTYSWETSRKYYAADRHSYGVPFAMIRALWTFFHIYFLRLGFLDGSRGLLVAVMFSQASFNKYAGLWYLEVEKKLKKKE